MRPILTSRYYWWLALLFLGVAIYGSLVPLHYRALPWSEAVARFREAMAEPVRVESRSDWAANILLFIPMGFLLMGALGVDRPAIVGWCVAVIVLPACTVLSASIEFTQLFFPGRVTSVDDVVAESIGAVVGTGLWLTLGQRLTLALRRFWFDLGGGRSTAGSLLQAYIVFLVLVHAMPMDLTISPAMLYHKYQQGRVILVPFRGGEQVDDFARIQKCLTNTAFFLPVGILAAGLANPFWRRGGSWPAVLGLGLGLAGMIELMQLFVYSRYFDATDIVTGGLGVLAGWAVGSRQWVDAQGQASEGRLPAHYPMPTTHYPQSTALAFCLLTAACCLVAFVEWQPFNFDFSGAEAVRRLREMSWLPFADYQQSEYLSAFDNICSKTVLFLPVGAILAWLGWGARGSGNGLVVLPPAILFTTLLEAGQLFLPTRYASITDVLIESFGVWVGFVIVRRGGG